METTTTKAKFGLKQAAKHPPKWLVPAFSLSVALLAAFQILIKSDPILTPYAKDIVEYYANCIIVLLTVIAPFFGVDIKKK